MMPQPDYIAWCQLGSPQRSSQREEEEDSSKNHRCFDHDHRCVICAEVWMIRNWGKGRRWCLCHRGLFFPYIPSGVEKGLLGQAWNGNVWRRFLRVEYTHCRNQPAKNGAFCVGEMWGGFISPGLFPTVSQILGVCERGPRLRRYALSAGSGGYE